MSDKKEAKQMVFPKTWEEFRATGLLLFINMFLHVFGWAIVVVVEEDGSVSKCYPARVKFRGFAHDSQDRAYKKLSAFMLENAEILKQEADE